MSYILVNTVKGTAYKKPGHVCTTSYETESGAKGVATRLNKVHGVGVYKPMTGDEFRAAYPVKMVERTNLMSGQTYMEAEDTPNFCSPSSESYWSS